VMVLVTVLLEEQLAEVRSATFLLVTSAGLTVSYTVSYAVVVIVCCVQTDSAMARPAMGRREKIVDLMMLTSSQKEG
jgi:hypothetical protein